MNRNAEGPVSVTICSVCGGPLPEGSNRKRRTCSSKCRQKRYRDGDRETISPEDWAAIHRVNAMSAAPGPALSPEQIRAHIASGVDVVRS